MAQLENTFSHQWADVHNARIPNKRLGKTVGERGEDFPNHAKCTIGANTGFWYNSLEFRAYTS